MKNKSILLILVGLSLMASLFFDGTRGMSRASAQAESARAPETTITVNSTADLDNSNSFTCASKLADPCTLRRAIVQARGLPAASRPVLIDFNVPTSDPGYDGSMKIWVFDSFKVATVDGPSTIFRSLIGGQITIDGSTQPGGRTNGPKIILVGPGTGSNSGLNLSAGSGNVIKGLAFQNFKDSITISSSDSIIEDNWFGLNYEGNLPAWRNKNDHKQGSGASGVVLITGADDNIIRNNVFLGLNGTAATIRGNENTFSNNKVGTTASGTTPGKTNDINLLCTEWDWYGGSGIRVDGDDHVIENNIFTGIRLDLFATSTQPEAIYLGETCDRVTVQNNKIGVDSEGKSKGVCGRGINIYNSKDLLIYKNVLANTHSSAIFLNGSLYRDNTLSENVIRKSTPWLWPDSQPKGDDAILRFTGLPDPFEFFNPAKVTSIQGKTVKGTSGEGSPCPNCKIELFQDDNDGIKEALQYLGSTTANASGNWTFTLAAELASNQGLRTTSTTMTPNIITGFGPGTTVGLSELYQAVNYVYLPLLLK